MSKHYTVLEFKPKPITTRPGLPPKPNLWFVMKGTTAQVQMHRRQIFQMYLYFSRIVNICNTFIFFMSRRFMKGNTIHFYLMN